MIKVGFRKTTSTARWRRVSIGKEYQLEDCCSLRTAAGERKGRSIGIQSSFSGNSLDGGLTNGDGGLTTEENVPTV